MSAAGKDALVNTVNRTSILARAASRAFIIVNNGKIVYHLDSTVRTGSLTLAAGDTAVDTSLSDNRALIVVTALNDNLFGVFNKMYDVIGAGLDTQATTDTSPRVDLRHAFISDANSVSRTYRRTVAVAKAGEITSAITREVKICRLAGLRTCVLVLSLGLARAVTSNVSYVLNNVAGLKPQNMCDLLGNTVSAGSTEVSLFGLALGESLRISFASGKSAGATVSTGENFTDSAYILVFLNAKKRRSYGEKQCAQHSDRADNENGNKYFHKVLPSFLNKNSTGDAARGIARLSVLKPTDSR